MPNFPLHMTLYQEKFDSLESVIWRNAMTQFVKYARILAYWIDPSYQATKDLFLADGIEAAPGRRGSPWSELCPQNSDSNI